MKAMLPGSGPVEGCEAYGFGLRRCRTSCGTTVRGRSGGAVAAEDGRRSVTVDVAADRAWSPAVVDSVFRAGRPGRQRLPGVPSGRAGRHPGRRPE
ncbi:hypothetical protein [Streptomyces sp. CAU 1734]|uniref:hypothetical protein n=1 Tax=Streptomyces sp. CAU 1734 TaxID=3140360 RepID=UPI00325FECA1